MKSKAESGTGQSLLKNYSSHDYKHIETIFNKEPSSAFTTNNQKKCNKYYFEIPRLNKGRLIIEVAEIENSSVILGGTCIISSQFDRSIFLSNDPTLSSLALTVLNDFKCGKIDSVE